jgi:asparagine synthase (glutamine-hydrolysing)
MCGIAGWIGRGPDAAVLKRLTDAIAHRGPDADGHWSDERISLGHRRLAIIDLAGSPQPMVHGDLVIVFNGEIYNFQDLRRELAATGAIFQTQGDTEVILQAYAAWGEAAFSRLKGMFAFVLYDRAKGDVWLVRDRLGKKPLYVWQGGGTLVFGSELQAVLADPAVPRQPDPTVLPAYLRWFCVPPPATGFLGIQALLPGECWHWRDGQVTQKRYWQPSLATEAIHEADALAECDRLLKQAIQRRLVAEVPLGAFLSGGIDSSLTVSLMAELSPTPVKTFAVGFADNAFDERPFARQIADRYGTAHTELTVVPQATELIDPLIRHTGAPFADSSLLPLWLLAKETRQHVTVAVGGDGGDEMFAGYERHGALLWSERLPMRHWLGPLAVAMGKAAPGRRLGARLARFGRLASLPAAERYVGWMARGEWTAIEPLLSQAGRALAAGPGVDAPPLATFRGFAGDAVGKACWTDLRHYLPDDLLVKADIGTMAHGLELRSPFLDEDIVDFAMRLPAGLRWQGWSGKLLLRRWGAGRLPQNLWQRRKQGFALPLPQWFREDLAPLAAAWLAKPDPEGLLDTTAMLRLLDEHQRGIADHSQLLWALLVWQRWWQRWFS